MFSVSFPCFIPSFLIIFHACSNAGLFKFIYINPYGNISHLSKTLRVFLCRSLLSHASHGSLSATCHSRLSHALRGPLSMTFRYISRKHFVFSRVITVCFAELMTSSVCKISPKFYILPTASYSVIIGWRIARIITPTINASIRIIIGSKTAIICSVAVVTSSS